MKLTDDQRAAVHAGGRRVAVVAGAGTGKTRVLTERYLHLAIDRGADLRRILAVTFTNKAAREMKERIRDTLADRGESERARQVEFAPISTVHTFLGRVLRERALDAGVDPRFAIADEVTAELLLDRAMDDAIAAVDDETRGALVDVAGGEDYLRGLYLAARATPHEFGELRAVEVDEQALRARLAALLDGLARCKATGKTAEKIQRLGAMRAGLLALDAGACAEFPSHILRWGGEAKEFAADAKALRDELALLAYRERAERSGAAIVRLLVDLDARFTEAKAEEGLIDFADIERLGLRLLRSEAGAKVAAEFDHMLVDEYQDTSRIQQAIVEALAERCDLFAVGDAKQSIYRFRYADASIFAELQAEADCFPLRDSFRSREPVVRFVNDLFERLFRGTGVAPQALDPKRTAWEREREGRVELLAPEGRNAFQARRREAHAIAARLNELVREREEYEFRECAILLPRMSNLSLYERALADQGIPYVVVKGRGYYAAREVVDLAHLLLALEDPFDEYRAVGAMTSLLCGVPETDLLHLAGDAPYPLRALGQERPETIPPDRWERLLTFAGRFEEWRRALQFEECGAVVERILADTRFADLLLLEPDGRRRHANLRKALRQARKTHVSPAEFARGLLEFREREVRESEAPIASEADDAVRIMTVHASKGLQFPLTVVADLSEGKRAVSGAILHPDGRFGFRLRGIPPARNVEPPGLSALKEWEKAQEEGERRRLWYVALTRAEEHLIVSWPRTESGTGNKALEHLLDDPPAGVGVIDPDSLRVPSRRGGVGTRVRAAVRRRAELPPPPDLARDDAAADVLLERVASFAPPATDGTPYIAAVADLVEFDRCPRRYRLGRLLGIDVESPVRVAEEARPRADEDEHPRRLLGTAFHKVIAEIEPGGVPTEEQVREQFPEAKAADVEKIAGWCAWLADQPISAELAGCKLVPEMDFLVRLGGLPVRGTIDLYTPDLPLLLDYKTSRRAKPEEYALQVAVYLRALRELDRPCPESAKLVYVDARAVHEVAPVDLDPLIERFATAHRGDGGFAPTPGAACEYCEFKAACLAQGIELPGSDAPPGEQLDFGL